MPRARPIALAAAGFATLLAAGYGWAQNAAQQQLDAALARLRSTFPPEVALTYASATTEPVTGRATLSGVVLTVKAKRIEATTITLDGLLPGGTGFAAGEARGIRFREAGATVGGIDRIAVSGLTLPPAGAPFDPLAILVDRAEISAFAFDAPASGLAIGRLLVEGFGGDRPGSFALETLQYKFAGNAYADSLTLRRAAATGLRFAETIRALQSGQSPPPPPGRSTFDIAAIAITAPGGREVLRVAAMSAEADDLPNRPGMQTTRMVLAGFDMPAPPELTFLRGLGYERLAFDFALEGDAAVAAGDFDVRLIRLVVPQAGNLDLAANLTGMPVPQGNGAPAPDMMEKARLVSFGLTYVDASLFNRVLRMQAREQRTTEQALRAQLGQMIAAVFSPTAGRGGAPDPIGEALLRFIRQPGTLEIHARPPQPVRLGDISASGPDGVAGMIRALGITVTAR